MNTPQQLPTKHTPLQHYTIWLAKQRSITIDARNTLMLQNYCLEFVKWLLLWFCFSLTILKERRRKAWKKFFSLRHLALAIWHAYPLNETGKAYFRWIYLPRPRFEILEKILILSTIMNHRHTHKRSSQNMRLKS